MIFPWELMFISAVSVYGNTSTNAPTWPPYTTSRYSFNLVLFFFFSFSEIKRKAAFFHSFWEIDKLINPLHTIIFTDVSNSSLPEGSEVLGFEVLRFDRAIGKIT